MFDIYDYKATIWYKKICFFVPQELITPADAAAALIWTGIAAWWVALLLLLHEIF